MKTYSPKETPDKEFLELIRVWDIPTRVFHWLLVVCFVGAWATDGSEGRREMHLMFGYTMLGLVLFRVFWGFVGSYYARFSSFECHPRKVIQYFKALLSGQPEHHVGHTPGGALAALALLTLGASVCGLGIATMEVSELDLGDQLFQFHHVLAIVMAVMVGIHLLGVLVGTLAHKESLLVYSMIFGRKWGRHDDRIGRRRWVIGLLLFSAVAGYWASVV